MDGFQLRISAVSTAGPSALTLDDFTFRNCQVPNTTMVCLSNQITCAQTGESIVCNKMKVTIAFHDYILEWESREGSVDKLTINLYFDGNCKGNMGISLAGLCVDESLVCDNTNDCGDLTDETDCADQSDICTFEENQACGWTQETDQDDLGMCLASFYPFVNKLYHKPYPLLESLGFIILSAILTITIFRLESWQWSNPSRRTQSFDRSSS